MTESSSSQTLYSRYFVGTSSQVWPFIRDSCTCVVRRAPAQLLPFLVLFPLISFVNLMGGVALPFKRSAHYLRFHSFCKMLGYDKQNVLFQLLELLTHSPSSLPWA